MKNAFPATPAGADNVHRDIAIRCNTPAPGLVISKAGARCLLGSGLVGGAAGSKGDTGGEGCDSHDERSAACAMTGGQHLAASSDKTLDVQAGWGAHGWRVGH